MVNSAKVKKVFKALSREGAYVSMKLDENREFDEQDTEMLQNLLTTLQTLTNNLSNALK